MTNELFALLCNITEPNLRTETVHNKTSRSRSKAAFRGRTVFKATEFPDNDRDSADSNIGDYTYARLREDPDFQ